MEILQYGRKLIIRVVIVTGRKFQVSKRLQLYNVSFLKVFELALKELYSEAPDAVFLLPFRNVTAWMQSLRKWDRIYTNMVGCELPKFLANSWNPNHFIDFYCDHVQSIRKFVYDHPTLTLIEFELNADVGEHLSSILEGIDASEWKRLNHGPRPQRKRRRGEGAN